jgi:hypothetical protein
MDVARVAGSMEERVNHGGHAPSRLLAQPQQMREKWKSLGFKRDGHFLFQIRRAKGTWVACKPHVADL